MGARILTVDDSKTIRLIIAKAFKPFDCEVLEAANGVEGLAMAKHEKPEVIILDLTMPVMDGYETLSKLKADPDLRSIPVVMLTAEAGRENVLRIARLGVRDYLVKPFKEDMIIERVGRIIDLKLKGTASARNKRFDDPLNLLVVDDKPAIADQIRAGLGDTTWSVEGRAQSGQAVDYCSQVLPDVILISLSLPDNAGFTLYQMLRASVKTKSVPVFGLCVKTALDDQNRAQPMGLTGIITKPIDLEDLKTKVARALNLDTSYRYFQHRDDVLLLSLPANYRPPMANEISVYLRQQVSEAVDAGLAKIVVDLSQLKTVDVSLIKLGLEILDLCGELSLKHRMIGSELISRECKQYEDAKDWRFSPSFEEALASFGSKELVNA